MEQRVGAVSQQDMEWDMFNKEFLHSATYKHTTQCVSSQPARLVHLSCLTELQLTYCKWHFEIQGPTSVAHI